MNIEQFIKDYKKFYMEKGRADELEGQNESLDRIYDDEAIRAYKEFNDRYKILNHIEYKSQNMYFIEENIEKKFDKIIKELIM